MKRPKLSIIILSYNTKDLLKQCLESIINELTDLRIKKFKDWGVEIIVVDNGSTDGSVEMIKEFRKFRGLRDSKKNYSNSPICNLLIKLIENKSNLGFAKGNNQATNVASGEFIFFLNSDTIINKGSLLELVTFLGKNTKAAALSPLIINKDGTIQKDPCYLRFPSITFCLVYYFKFLKKLAEKFFPRLVYSTLNFCSVSKIEQVSGAALMIRKSFFQKIGGFDERFIHFFEDVDLSWRLKKMGFELFLVPKVKIIHFGGKSLASKIEKEGIESFYFLNFDSLFKFCEKNFPLWKVLIIKIIIFFNLFLKFRFGLIKKLYF